MSLPLDPLPYYVSEADDFGRGPEFEEGRYSYSDVLDYAYDDYGRESTLYALARFLPREGYEQDLNVYSRWYQNA